MTHDSPGDGVSWLLSAWVQNILRNYMPRQPLLDSTEAKTFLPSMNPSDLIGFLGCTSVPPKIPWTYLSKVSRFVHLQYVTHTIPGLKWQMNLASSWWGKTIQEFWNSKVLHSSDVIVRQIKPLIDCLITQIEISLSGHRRDFSRRAKY